MRNLIQWTLAMSVVMGASTSFAEEAPSPAAAATPETSTPVTSLAVGTTTLTSSDVVLQPREGATERSWYGWQGLIFDGAGLGLVLGGFASNTDVGGTLYASGLGVMGLGGPIIHLVHDRYLVALASLGVRVGGAVLGTLVGLAIGGAVASSENAQCNIPDGGSCPGFTGLLVGFGAGAFVGGVIDDSLLAWERVPRETGVGGASQGHDSPRSTSSFALSLTPMVGPRRSGMSVVGTF